MKKSISRLIPYKILRKLLPARSWIRFLIWRIIRRVKAIVIPGAFYRDPYAASDLYWASPDSINYVSLVEHGIYKNKGAVCDGDWDVLDKKVEDLDFYTSFYKKTTEHTGWAATAYYQRVLKEINQGEIKWGCKTQKDLDARCEELDRIYEDMRANGYKPSNNEDEITVNIGRHGDLLFNNGRHRLVFAKLLKLNKIPVKITGRHAEWVAFKNEILDYTARTSNSKTYAPLTHLDLASIPAQHGEQRFGLIREHLVCQKGSMLDIGSNWGYFCHKFEDLEFQCYSLENNPTNLYFLNKLKRAENKKFTIVPESVFSFIAKNKDKFFDVTLALAIFHHFIKTEEAHASLVELLSVLKTKEMYFQPHLADEGQMRKAYKNYAPEEFVLFIIRHSCLSKYELIGTVEDGRPIYKIY
jgi:hypothetical protein